MRKSKIYLMGDDDFVNLVKRSTSLSDVVRSFGLSTNGTGGFTVVKRRISALKIDCSHIEESVRLRRLDALKLNVKRALVDVLIENSTYINTHHLKLRLIREAIFVNRCSNCGIERWDDKEISLHMDHVNGNRRDNRIENLRLLCPNCHSQTNTYAGKKLKIVYTCSVCGNKIGKKSVSGICRSCNNANNKAVVGKCKITSKCPSREELEKQVWEVPTSKLCQQYGVSDKAVEKWCKKYGIKKPPRGYWAKLMYLK